MEAKEKAAELVGYFRGVVYPFIGSSMLTNDICEDTILRNSKTCARKIVEEVVKQLEEDADTIDGRISAWWCEVGREIDKV